MNLRCVMVSLLAVGMAVGAASPAAAQQQGTIDLIPTHAGGFVHVNVESLLAAEQLEFATDLLHRVDQELAGVFRRHLGVNALKLKDAAILLPPLEVAFADGSDDPATLGIFGFSQAYDYGLLLKGIGGTWSEIKGENSIYYRNEQGLTVLLLNDHTFLCGAEGALQWWLTSLTQTDHPQTLINAITNARDGAAVTVALNTEDLPTELLTEIPLPVRGFAQSEAIILNLYVSDTFDVFLAVDYTTAGDASRAERSLRTLIDLGRTMLSQLEVEYQQQVTAETGTLDEALGAVGLLALVRHADAHLQNIRVSRDDYQLQAQLQIDTPAPVLLAGALSAVAAIGAEANDTFQNVSGQLGQPAR